jgi:hypothetical protein
MAGIRESGKDVVGTLVARRAKSNTASAKTHVRLFFAHPPLSVIPLLSSLTTLLRCDSFTGMQNRNYDSSILQYDIHAGKCGYSPCAASGILLRSEERPARLPSEAISADKVRAVVERW